MVQFKISTKWFNLNEVKWNENGKINVGLSRYPIPMAMMDCRKCTISSPIHRFVTLHFSSRREWFVTPYLCDREGKTITTNSRRITQISDCFFQVINLQLLKNQQALTSWNWECSLLFKYWNKTKSFLFTRWVG